MIDFDFMFLVVFAAIIVDKLYIGLLLKGNPIIIYQIVIEIGLQFTKVTSLSSDKSGDEEKNNSATNGVETKAGGILK